MLLGNWCFSVPAVWVQTRWSRTKCISSKSISNTWVEYSDHHTKIFNTVWHLSGFREVDKLYVCHLLEMITDSSNISTNGRQYWRNNIFYLHQHRFIITRSHLLQGSDRSIRFHLFSSQQNCYWRVMEYVTFL